MTDDADWQRIIGVLSGQVPELAENFLSRILVDPAYSESGLTMEDLRSSSEDSFRAMLKGLARDGTDLKALESLAAELGARRARQRVPLESLVRAIRTDFSLLWEALSAPSLGASPGLLVHRTELVWQVVDIFATRVRESYLVEYEDLERADADLQHQYLTRLFAAAEPSPPDMARIVGALRINADAEFLVAAVSRDDSLTVQRRLNLHAKWDERAFAFDQGHHTLIILQRRTSSRTDLSFEERSVFDGIAAAVAPPVYGFAGVRMAVIAAREIMTDLPMGGTGIFRLQDRWESVTHHRLAQVGCDPAHLVYPYLRRCSEGERERLLETVSAFLDSGSLVETSALLGCHRNTIVNRLSTFEKYTGLNLQKPRDAAAVLLALYPLTTLSRRKAPSISGYPKA
ncbi:helix-turn-helix domain-containing protein [Pseudarthrobacter sulfonivorans]|uniref:helix-turn-helix domain-containing protein n=1 Tax=Pseudarthrobacter sulfonivorans TaxID=121292 RepID=UPI0012FD39D7|nr:helix-turn-helix domain-containing protein [Pseudarthrobacter sulfonivorans]